MTSFRSNELFWMKRIALWSCAACIATLAMAGESVVSPGLSAAQIVEKYVASRGGQEAWRKIQTMVWVGHIESTHASAPSMPFVLELKRPNKTRFEIKAQSQATVRMYDGYHGWKLRPARNGRLELQPYTDEELSFARDGQGIDGQLMDYQAKGIKVMFDGLDEVEGKKAYRLSVVLPSGASHHVWLDAQTFLEIKYDRESRNTLGQTGMVSVFYRDYRLVEGLQIPFLIESGSDTAKARDKMIIDRISLNPPLEDRIFAKPNLPGQRNGVTVDIDSPQSIGQAIRPVTLPPDGFPKLNPRSVSGAEVAR